MTQSQFTNRKRTIELRAAGLPSRPAHGPRRNSKMTQHKQWIEALSAAIRHGGNEDWLVNRLEAREDNTDMDMTDALYEDGGYYHVLHRACQLGRVGAVVAIIQAGCDVDVRIPKGDRKFEDGGYGMTPLMVACYGGHSECVKALLDWGADPTIKGKLGGRSGLQMQTAEDIAREGRKFEIAYLIAKAESSGPTVFPSVSAREMVK